jgi:hypothetical protein
VKAAEHSTARLTVGFFWPWSDPRTDGTLIEDFVIGDYVRPLNAKSDSGRLAFGIPTQSLCWRTQPWSDMGSPPTIQCLAELSKKGLPD